MRPPAPPRALPVRLALALAPALVVALVLTLVLALAPLSPAFAQQEATPPAELGDYRGARESVHPDWFKQSFLDLADDIAEAAAGGRRLVLYFWQPGCPYCAELIENNFGQQDIGEAMRRQFDVVALNMWGDREVVQVGGRSFTEKTMAEALRVHYTPTLLFFNEQGKVALRLDGYVPPERFRLAIDYAAPGSQASGTFRDFVASRDPAPASGVLHRQPFFRPPPHDLAAALGEAPLAVYFEQAQCSQCDNLHQKVLADPPTLALAQRFHAIQLDMWSDTPLVRPDGTTTSARQWAAELGISYAPSIVFFDAAGDEIMRIDGLLRTFHVQSVMDYVLSGDYREQPNFQRYISARAEHLREQGIDVDIWGY